MSGKEIKVSEYELAACNGNLSTLASSWAGIPKLDALDGSNIGRAADIIRECLDEANSATKSMSDLLINSLEFFRAAGIQFMESDKKASGNIDTLVT